MDGEPGISEGSLKKQPPSKPKKTLSVSGRLDQNEFDIEVKKRPREDERTARLDLEIAEAAHQRKKDYILFVVVIVLVGSVTFSCVIVMIFSFGTADSQKTATSLLTVIVSAAAGYVTGKSSGNK